MINALPYWEKPDSSFQEDDEATAQLPQEIRDYMALHSEAPFSATDALDLLRTKSVRYLLWLLREKDRQVIRKSYGGDHPSLKKVNQQ